MLAVCHRLRECFVSERTRLMCRIGAILLEFGLSLPRGHATMKRLFQWLATKKDELPPALMQKLQVAHDHYKQLNERITEQDRKIQASAKQDERCQLLKSIPCVGGMIASQLVMTVGSAVSIGARDGRLAGVGAETVFDGEQAEAAGHQQARQ